MQKLLSNEFIVHISSLFTIAIVIWGIFAYLDIWVLRNAQITFKIISKLLLLRTQISPKTPLDYFIVQGYYKGRKVVCRINCFFPKNIFHYDLYLHIYMEPQIKHKPGFLQMDYLTKNTHFREDSKIYYQRTTSTAIKSYFFADMISEEEFINIFEELTIAAEKIESELNDE
ncbi:MAG: hypothetical protein ABIC68_00200 [Candidatus Omnitrophota bacterium]